MKNAMLTSSKDEDTNIYGGHYSAYHIELDIKAVRKQDPPKQN